MPPHFICPACGFQSSSREIDTGKLRCPNCQAVGLVELFEVVETEPFNVQVPLADRPDARLLSIACLVGMAFTMIACYVIFTAVPWPVDDGLMCATILLALAFEWLWSRGNNIPVAVRWERVHKPVGMTIKEVLKILGYPNRTQTEDNGDVVLTWSDSSCRLSLMLRGGQCSRVVEVEKRDFVVLKKVPAALMPLGILAATVFGSMTVLLIVVVPEKAPSALVPLGISAASVFGSMTVLLVVLMIGAAAK